MENLIGLIYWKNKKKYAAGLTAALFFVLLCIIEKLLRFESYAGNHVTAVGAIGIVVATNCRDTPHAIDMISVLRTGPIICNIAIRHFIYTFTIRIASW